MVVRRSAGGGFVPRRWLATMQRTAAECEPVGVVNQASETASARVGSPAAARPSPNIAVMKCKVGISSLANDYSLSGR
jgi:hypothetical protein